MSLFAAEMETDFAIALLPKIPLKFCRLTLCRVQRVRAARINLYADTTWCFVDLQVQSPEILVIQGKLHHLAVLPQKQPVCFLCDRRGWREKTGTGFVRAFRVPVNPSGLAENMRFHRFSIRINQSLTIQSVFWTTFLVVGVSCILTGLNRGQIGLPDLKGAASPGGIVAVISGGLISLTGASRPAISS